MATNDSELKIVVNAQDNASKELAKVSKNLSNTKGEFEGFGKALKPVGIAVAGVGVALTAISKSAVDSTIEFASSVKQLSRETGINTTKMSELVYAFQRTGLSAGEASSTLGIFAKKINENNKATAESVLKQADLKNKMEAATIQIKLLTAEKAKAGDKTGELSNKIAKLNLDLQQYQVDLKATAGPLTELGIKTKNADGSARAFDQILLEVADKFKAMPNGAEKTALAMQLFGRAGKDLIPILNQGSQGMTELMKRADKLGITLTPQNIEKVNKYIEAQKSLADSTQSLTIAIGLKAIPMWQKLTEITNNALTSLIEAPSPIKEIATSFIALGGPALTAAGSLLTFGAELGTILDTKLLPTLGVLMAGIGDGFMAVAGFILGPWGIAIALLVAGLVLLIRHFGGIQGALDALMPPLQTLWSGMVILLQPAIDNLKVAWGELVAAIGPLMPLLGEAAKWLAIIAVLFVAGLIVTLALVVAAVANVIGWIARLVGILATDLANAFHHPIDAAKNFGIALLGFLGPVGFVIQRVEQLIGLFFRLKDAAGALKGGNISGGLHALGIPGFATGVRNFRGGLAVVGEQGPELVNLPAGSDVIPNGQGGGITQHNTFNIHNDADPVLIARQLGWDLANA